MKTFSYSATGNVTAKSDVGTYTYPAAQPRPHAVTSISGESFVSDSLNRLTSATVALSPTPLVKRYLWPELHGKFRSAPHWHRRSRWCRG